MNSILLILWCNLAVVLSASTYYQPRGISVRASGSLGQTSHGSNALTRRQLPNAQSSDPSSSTDDRSSIEDADDKQEPKTVAAPKKHGTSDSFDDAQTELKSHFSHMKKSMKKLEKSFTGHKAKAELEEVFTNAKQGLLIVKAHSGELSSLTGVGQQELEAFFFDLEKSIYDLHKALKNSDDKLEDAKAFFEHLVKIVSSLQTSSESSKAKSEQVKSFFTKVIFMITKLEEALESPKEKPHQAGAEVREFFLELGASVSSLEAAMKEQGAEEKTGNNWAFEIPVGSDGKDH